MCDNGCDLLSLSQLVSIGWGRTTYHESQSYSQYLKEVLPVVQPQNPQQFIAF